MDEEQNGAMKLTVLIGNDLPELGTDLVAALPSLDVNDLAHVLFVCPVGCLALLERV